MTVPKRHQATPTGIVTTSDGLRRLQLGLEAQIAAASGGGVNSFNGRTGAVVFVPADINAALGYIPEAPTANGYQAISIVDLPEADPAEPLLRMRLTAGMTFVDGVADAAIAATASSALRIRKNGSANGTITFTGSTGVVSFTNLVYAPGDLFELYPPSTIDATLDRVSITLRTT